MSTNKNVEKWADDWFRMTGEYPSQLDYLAEWCEYNDHVEAWFCHKVESGDRFWDDRPTYINYKRRPVFKGVRI